MHPLILCGSRLGIADWFICLESLITPVGVGGNLTNCKGQSNFSKHRILVAPPQNPTFLQRDVRSIKVYNVLCRCDVWPFPLTRRISLFNQWCLQIIARVWSEHRMYNNEVYRRAGYIVVLPLRQPPHILFCRMNTFHLVFLPVLFVRPWRG